MSVIPAVLVLLVLLALVAGSGLVGAQALEGRAAAYRPVDLPVCATVRETR